MQHTQHTHLAALIIYDPLDVLVETDRGGNGAIVEMGEKLRWVGVWMWGAGGREEELGVSKIEV